MKHVVLLGVTGSVAAYRAADLARDFMRAGTDVRVCLTRSAAEFVRPSLFEALTGNPCLSEVFEEPIAGRMAHIDWARQASLVLVAPATANAIANIAHGNAEDMLTTIISATSAPIIVAPAMNPQMFASDANQLNLSILEKRGIEIIRPQEGDVACGEHGEGKLAANAAIVDAALAQIGISRLYEGKTVVITAGPTHEAIDPVRYISNRSSGKMGIALAKAAVRMGASVKLVLGPTHLAPPPAAQTTRVTTAKEMLEATLLACEGADLLIGSAAVADFHVADTGSQKIESGSRISLRLEPNPDILGGVHAKYPDLPIVGFAAEVGGNGERARQKIAKKGLAGIALNDVSRKDIGFEADENELILFFADGKSTMVPQSSKFMAALRILELVSTIIGRQKT
ncbi:MAG TPA: bifunctional phosphopantothenoylcysteine decarboxylase/phosphopantothenate--cysteine ligase CoaBC [Fimbriimonadales bacterium]|nr:bifunctional phosphopantothenoylcysteine decarboxylase/phosphopantothenate--cysteine ligase CoaBC [Fimbriimonadales bacterium]